MTGVTRTSDPVGEHAPSKPRWKVLLVLVESALVVALLLVWLLSEHVRQSKSLWVLFFYSFPSEFLVGLVPHEPVLIYYGEYHAAWIVALVSAVSTAMAEGLNYTLFGVINDRPSIRSISENRMVRRTMELFGRLPFAAIVFAGLTPVPFFPVRILVVMTAYPIWKYLLGVFLSRAPRFFILAAMGAYLDIPVGLLSVLFIVLLVSVNVPAVVRLLVGSERR